MSGASLCPYAFGLIGQRPALAGPSFVRLSKRSISPWRLPGLPHYQSTTIRCLYQRFRTLCTPSTASTRAHARFGYACNHSPLFCMHASRTSLVPPSLLPNPSRPSRPCLCGPPDRADSHEFCPYSPCPLAVACRPLAAIAVLAELPSCRAVVCCPAIPMS